jgi:Concanavalin A-like lectin/glucanases superfamily
VTYSSVVLSDSPRAYWRLGEASGTTAADQVGAAAGTYRNGVTLGVTGALVGDTNKAVRFDGSDDRVGMGDPSSGVLDFGSGDLSIEAWVKATANGDRVVLAKRGTSGSYYQLVVTDDSGHVGEIRASFSSGGTTRNAYGPVIRVDNGAWHHVVVVFDRDVGVTVYVDGVARSTAGALTGSLSNSTEFLLGRSGSLLSASYRGDLDEVALYSGVLSAGRVQAHRATGLGT